MAQSRGKITEKSPYPQILVMLREKTASPCRRTGEAAICISAA
jgi:hypothetical protein